MNAFETREVRTESSTVFLRFAGSGPPLLLLHGFPQTHLMWRWVGPRLSARFTIVCADLRGYGHSGCPASAEGHAPYSKRAMASEMVEVMRQMDFPRFSVAGHDRGARVAYRMALDHPESVERLAVLDIVPTETVWAHADVRFALAYWPWSLLAQPEPLAERMLVVAAEAIVDNALSAWGSNASAFPADIRAAYVEALREPGHAHAIAEEYRAAASIDRAHDREDIDAGRRIVCPTLALWSAEGPLDTWYAKEGGPLALWRSWCNNVRGTAVEGGHFFPEEDPEQTAAHLQTFFAG